MYVLDELKEMISRELKTITRQDSITPQTLEAAYKAVDILKDIETIEAMQEAGYSNNSYNSYDDMSYTSMRSNGNGMGYSYARGRDSRGRYTSRDYSRHAELDHMLGKLEMMSDDTDDPKVKKAIDQCIAKIEG